MSIERFNVTPPTRYQGLTALAAKENLEFAEELVRRLTVNQDTILNALTEQVVVEKSILPLLQAGSSSTNVAISVSTTDDSTGAEIEAILWMG